LSGTDAIAWNRLGEEHSYPGRSLTGNGQQELEQFYLRLAWILDDLRRIKEAFPSDEDLKNHFKTEDGGKFITHRERLSIPELVKRLATLPKLAKQTGLTNLGEGFKDIYREPGYWTGWFMGDGDKVGEKLKKLAERNPDNPEKRDQDLTHFTELMRTWGQDFKDRQDLFPGGKGRVVYAGGDDFLGVLYSEEPETQEKPEKIRPIEAWNWLLKLPEQWQELQKALADELNLKDENRLTYSVGFVWAGHQVPQRDILQHCREAEKRSKNLERDRLTIRVVFNSGQYVQWTCPWAHLKILDRYQDRVGGKNWAHLYNDWAHLKSRHAIRLREVDQENYRIDQDLALAMLDLYFDGLGQEIQEATVKKNQWKAIAGDNSAVAVVQWINDLVQVGWQLCSNT
jgi:CRISPR-associated protein Cmr2